MPHSWKSWVLTAALLSAPGCSDGSPTDPATPLSAADPATILEVGGDWIWTSEERLTFPEWVAVGIFGIAPEGPVTVALCENAGTMTLNQVGASFTGTSQRTAHQCVTTGGQTFQDPASFVPAAIEDGLVQGTSAKWVLAGVVVTCPHHAVLSEMQGIAAQALEGTARCIVPGHPLSDIPIDPPPGGTSTTLEWSAVRP